MSETAELETRREIFSLIKNHPGLHLSKISELLNMRVSLVEYHLLTMEKNEVISSIKETGFKRYYIKDEIGAQDKKVLSILRQEKPLKIILFLLKNPNSRHKEILQNFEMAPSTLSYYLKKIVKKGIISVDTYGDEKGYSVVNEKRITRVLILYKPYAVLDSFKDIWKDLTV